MKVTVDTRGRRIKLPRGHPPHEPTAQTRHTVRKMVVTGYFRQEHIADCLGIDVKTLRKYYRPELVKAKGEFATNMMMVAELKAVGGPPLNGVPNWREADAGLLKFLLERVCGMVPPALLLRHSGAIGSFDLTKLSDEELSNLEAIRAKIDVASAAVDSFDPFDAGDLGGESEEGGE